MTDPMNIHQRIAAVMAQVTYIQKEAKKGMNYTIVSHDAVTAKVRPAMLAARVIYYPVRCDHSNSGGRAECSMTVRFVNIDMPSDFIDVQSFGYGVDPQDKGPGKAMSYAVKYALLKCLGLETGDDPDQDAQTSLPPFDPVAAADRLIAKMQRQTTEAGLKAAWDSEKDARGDIKDADPALYARVVVAVSDHKKSLKKDDAQ